VDFSRALKLGINRLPKIMSVWMATDLGDSLTSDNAEPSNLRSGAPQVSEWNHSEILATPIAETEKCRNTGPGCACSLNIECLRSLVVVPEQWGDDAGNN